MPMEHYARAGAYAAALLITLVLAAFGTPRRWWRQPNALALGLLLAGSWSIGGILLRLATPPAAAPTAAPAPAHSAALAGAPRVFYAHQDLNLRAASGIDSVRVALVPIGSRITVTGARDGDWWQVKARLGRRELQGWTSSLWLRRAEEMRTRP